VKTTNFILDFRFFTECTLSLSIPYLIFKIPYSETLSQGFIVTLISVNKISCVTSTT